MAERTYLLDVPVAAPIRALSRRSLRAALPIVSPLLRALGPGEQPEAGTWSVWLAGWGWTWAGRPELFTPSSPLLRLWVDWERIAEGVDFRVLSLAVALRLKVDGMPLVDGSRPLPADLDRIWRTVEAMPRESLGEALSLALLRADTDIFAFGSAAPAWPADVTAVLAERRTLQVRRSPAPAWLREGYALLGEEGFGSLRALGHTFADCEEVWNSFCEARTPPAAFAMAFWWEAAACLTERHAYDEAELAQRRLVQYVGTLEELTGLIEPRWRRQQGRLYYYAGNHEAALAEYLREYQVARDDLNVSAMLEREISGVLSDLSCLEAAAVFAERSVATARMQGQDAELYKSLGRLAEIRIKQGDPHRAKDLQRESLAIQERDGSGERSPAQTLTYLGHACLLSGEPDEAAEWYGRAQGIDGGESSRPYVIMGRMALAAAAGNRLAVDELWMRHSGELDAWIDHVTHVLPGAAFCLAASRLRADAAVLLPAFVRALIDKRYAIEARYLLARLGEQGPTGLEREIDALLLGWQRGLAAIPPAFRALTGPLNGPERLREEFRKPGWQDDPALCAQCYPMTLATLGDAPVPAGQGGE